MKILKKIGTFPDMLLFCGFCRLVFLSGFTNETKEFFHGNSGTIVLFEHDPEREKSVFPMGGHMNNDIV